MRFVAAILLSAALLFFSPIANAQNVLFRPLIGGFPADAGFALGGDISRTRTPGPIDVRVRGILSVKKYQLYEAGFDVPELGRWLSLSVTGRYRNLPQEDFWGLGPNTQTDARTNYLLEDVDVTARLWTSVGRFRTGVSGGYLRINTGPGRDNNLPSIPESLQSSPRFKHIGAFLEYQSLDEESDPHSGGMYSFEWTTYLSSLQSYVVDVRRFIPVTATDRIGLRMQTSFTHSSDSEEVPFFMLPTVGGSHSVRGFNSWRFRDRNALVLNAEYRRPLTGFLDIVGFADAGRVFTRAANLGLQDLHPSAGVGVRVKFGSRIFFGIDVGFSGERTKLSFRSDQMF
jgi:hypothetical protein